MGKEEMAMRSTLLDGAIEDRTYLGGTIRPVIGGSIVLPIDEKREQRLRREREQDLKRYRLSLKYDAPVAREEVRGPRGRTPKPLVRTERRHVPTAPWRSPEAVRQFIQSLNLDD